MKMCDHEKRVSYPVVVFVCVLFLNVNGICAKICNSTDVRAEPKEMEKLRGCEVIEGPLQISLMDWTSKNYSEMNEFSFPELREITDYLVIYRVKGIQSLGKLFPNLSIIRGERLIANSALTIYQLDNITEIGLTKLTDITKGMVVIRENPLLCTAETIDWERIMNKGPGSYYDLVVTANGYEDTFCRYKAKKWCENCESGLCWAEGKCQTLHLDCHPLCAGGCSEPNNAQACYVCKGVLDPDNKCVEACPPGTFKHLERRCISDEVCYTSTVNTALGTYTFFPHLGECRYSCPQGYRHKSKPREHCIPCNETSCPKVCDAPQVLNETGTFRVTLAEDSEVLRGCTIINGSLALVGLINDKSTSSMHDQLVDQLGWIEEITGQLKVMHSHSLTSLNFLKNLRVIGGEYLLSDFNPGMADERTFQTLVVKDNKNLVQLWDWDKRPNGLEITKGTVLFHYNPKLCLSVIDEFIRKTNLSSRDDEQHISRESNGDKTMCSTEPFFVKVVKVTTDGIVLAVKEKPNRTLEGRFMVFYRVSNGVPLNDSVLYESLNQCGNNYLWKVTKDVEANLTNQALNISVPHLEPATEYIYFVRRLSTAITSSPMEKVTTLSAQPSVPQDLKMFETLYNAGTGAAISLKWGAPLYPHGEIDYYVIRGFYQSDYSEDLENRDYCLHTMSKESWTSKDVFTSYTLAGFPDVCPPCQNETCSAYDHRSFFDLQRYDVKLDACDAYFFRLMERGKATSNKNVVDRINIDFAEPQSHLNREVYSSYPSEPEIGIDGRYNAFWMKVNASNNTVRVDNLRHFSQYVVMLSACQHPDVGVPCSRDVIVTVRTANNGNTGDAINPSKVSSRVDNRTMTVKWEEPTTVNSFIHSYIITYHFVEEHIKFERICVTARRFRESNNSVSLFNLAYGNYTLQLRAVSLFGEGPPFEGYFSINEPLLGTPENPHWNIAFIVILICFIVVISFSLYLLHVRRKRVLYASVNPKYEPVYLADHYEVPRENLTLVKQLGRGTFGSVHEGVLAPDNIRCAVKTTTSVGDEDNTIFLQEATLMKEFHNAHHIVKLIGVISKGSPVYVIMDLMEKGDLKTFLLRSGPQLCDETKTLPASMVLKMAAQIADGMAFLEAKKFVHRDLAARNCMVAADNTIKIGDFGLARDIYETDYYRRGDKATLPIRWMAPESIRDGIFTSSSDMWSYGIVLWEITTLAQMPYHPRSNEEVIKYIQTGQLLEIPSNAHEVIKPLMSHCWKWQASLRPKFTQVLKILDSYVDSDFRKVSFFHNGEDPKDSTKIPPSRGPGTEDCYIYNDENHEINLNLGEIPSVSDASASTSRSVRYSRFIPRLMGEGSKSKT